MISFTPKSKYLFQVSIPSSCFRPFTTTKKPTVTPLNTLPFSPPPAGGARAGPKPSFRPSGEDVWAFLRQAPREGGAPSSTFCLRLWVQFCLFQLRNHANVLRWNMMKFASGEIRHPPSNARPPAQFSFCVVIDLTLVFDHS